MSGDEDRGPGAWYWRYQNPTEHLETIKTIIIPITIIFIGDFITHQLYKCYKVSRNDIEFKTLNKTENTERRILVFQNVENVDLHQTILNQSMTICQ